MRLVTLDARLMACLPQREVLREVDCALIRRESLPFAVGTLGDARVGLDGNVTAFTQNLRRLDRTGQL